MFIRNTLIYAYVIGFCERLRFGDGFGRTHPHSGDWNEAYDRGANLADLIWARA
jgi:hypothetical protein